MLVIQYLLVYIWVLLIASFVSSGCALNLVDYNSSLPLARSNEEYCNRPWPQLDLILPISLTHGGRDARRYEAEALFFRSLFLFWPLKISNISVTSIVDEEQVGSALYFEYKQTLEGFRGRVPGGLNLVTSPAMAWFRQPKDRMPHMLFWADNFSTSDYVGFVDTDCVFLTYIDREVLYAVSYMRDA